MPVLITGTTGQVGGALAKLLDGRAAFLAPTREEMDLFTPDSIRFYLAQTQPSWIINCAAYTAVDAAETDCNAAFAANAIAPGILAEEAAKRGIPIVHISTDYVFPGTGERPWVETDPTDPPNVYGASKLAGEQAIAASGALHIILRTSWVYSGGGKNFVRTMLRLLTTKDQPLRVVDDQHGAPTSAEDLAEAILTLMERTETTAIQTETTPATVLAASSGIYHCAGSGETTWAGLANEVRDYLVAHHGLKPPHIIGVSSSEYPTPAARPKNSRLDCTKLARNLGLILPEWQLSVATALRQLTEKETSL